MAGPWWLTKAAVVLVLPNPRQAGRGLTVGRPARCGAISSHRYDHPSVRLRGGVGRERREG